MPRLDRIDDHGQLGGLGDDDHDLYALDQDLTDHEALADVHHAKTPPGLFTSETEDGNSPFTASGATSLSGTLASEYDHVWLVVDDLSPTVANSSNLMLTINGVTSGYTRYELGGSRVGGDSKWFPVRGELDNTSRSWQGILYVSGSWTGGASFVNSLGGEVGNNHDVKGYNTQASSPLDSFTLDGTDTEFDATVEVHGL